MTSTSAYQKDSEKLETLFGNTRIEVRGFPGKTSPTVLEFNIYLKGYLGFGATSLFMRRFHHKANDDEFLSYALLIAPMSDLISDYSYWVVFPAFVRLGGGQGRSGYDKVEKLIGEAQHDLGMTQVEIEDVEISEESFLEFLKARAEKQQ
jgi:hypothetical protein